MIQPLEPASTRFLTPAWQRQRQRLELLFGNGALFARNAETEELQLRAADAYRFCRPWQTVTTSAVVADGDGTGLRQEATGSARAAFDDLA